MEAAASLLGRSTLLGRNISLGRSTPLSRSIRWAAALAGPQHIAGPQLVLLLGSRVETGVGAVPAAAVHCDSCKRCAVAGAER